MTLEERSVRQRTGCNLIKDNTFYVRKGVPFVRKNMDGGNYTLENNQIVDLEN